MSNSKMLIDATHPEETRVVVQRNGRVEEFDFESAARKLLRGNIYLAKVTRVEPSLQAAFIDYGGNRHGFLAFNEIHPDYYQIPVADRQALIDEEAAAEAELEAAADRRAEAMAKRARPRNDQQGQSRSEQQNFDDAHDGGGEDGSNIVDVEEDEHIEEIGGDGGDDDAPTTFPASVTSHADVISEPIQTEPHPHDVHVAHEADHPAHTDGAHDHHDHAPEAHGEHLGEHPGGPQSDHHDHEHQAADDHGHSHDHGHHDAAPAPTGEMPEEVGQPGVIEDMQMRPRRRPRSYKIQEVIKRRQVILVQVVKEERGNKGAALTTYLSLAGRYTVLMPNTARGGGISRKITQPQDRKRLKAIAQELEVPEGMGLIIRTAGAARTKQEIKRDFEYLLRLWESVRDLTLQSTAPALVYEEGDLIKRSIRDLYNKDVEEVVVAGAAGYTEAHDFMQMLMPSHVKNVIEYKDPTPLFTRFGTERQLNAMFSPQVTLRSGGYIVINQTEALVAIDVNSGKSTREFSIEETALATNLEASDEIARQLKLRDLAGLIVIDFIDMEEKRNNRSVERRLKDALRHDRARIQLGRISHFGLMEMSRQRLRTGVLEGSTSQCTHCQGTGIIRSTESVALAVLRGIEDAITAGSNAALIATTTPTVALYILNSKRAYVTDMEARHGYPITILGADRIHGANFTVERGAATAIATRRPERAAVNMDWGFEGEEEGEVIENAADAGPAFVADVEDDASPLDREAREVREGGEDGARRRKRRRRRGRRGDQEGPRSEFQNNGSEAGQDGEAADGDDDEGDETSENAGNIAMAGNDGSEAGDGDGDGDENENEASNAQPGDPNDKPSRRRRRGRRGGRRGRAERGDRDNADQHAQGSGTDPSGEPRAEPMHAAPGFEPQPDVAPLTRPPFDGAHGNGHDQPRRQDRPQRPERVWDTPRPQAASESRPERHREPEPTFEGTPEAVAPVVHRHEPERHVPAPAVVHAPAPEPVIVEVTPARPRHETGSSEPRIERVVVKPGESENAGAGDAPAVPQRKGWWQRKFSGE